MRLLACLKFSLQLLLIILQAMYNAANIIIVVAVVIALLLLDAMATPAVLRFVHLLTCSSTECIGLHRLLSIPIPYRSRGPLQRLRMRPRRQTVPCH